MDDETKKRSGAGSFAEKVEHANEALKAFQPTQSRATPSGLNSSGEPHSNHHKFTVGGALYAFGFRRQDADALTGILSMSVSEVIALFTARADSATFAHALQAVFALRGPSLKDRGRAVALGRRWVAYREELASWREVESDIRARGSWREKSMSEGQRHLVRVTAVLLDLPIPVEMNRGEAADWLDRHGANLSYEEG